MKKAYRVKYTIKGQEGFGLYYCGAETRKLAEQMFFRKYPRALIAKHELRREHYSFGLGPPEAIYIDEVKD